MVKRFHADPRVQATELLLQERVPRAVRRSASRARSRRRASRAPAAPPRPAASARRTPRSRTRSSSPTATTPPSSPTPAAGPASAAAGRSRATARTPTRDPGSQFLYLRDVRSGAVWSATYHPVGKDAEDYVVTFLAEKATFRRRDDDIATQLDIAVSTEDDVEVRRLAVTNHGDRPREIEVTSYAEIVLAPPADDLAHPAFEKLFVETEYLPESAALALPSAPARARRGRRPGPCTC